MAIRKRKTTKGESAEYHYEFMQGGKRYYGVCEKCTNQREAQAYEKTIRDKAKLKTVKKNNKAILEEVRREIIGGEKIKLADAYELSLKKPRKRPVGEDRKAFKRAYWNNFVLYLADHHPDIDSLDSVEQKHAEEYLQYLKSKGKYIQPDEEKEKDEEKKEEKIVKLSSATLNQYHMALAEVFTLLSKDGGIFENPFTSIPKLKIEAETREAFTEAELRKINKKLDDFSRPLFTIAISTALREGDICTLKWDEVDLEIGVISRGQMRKTGHAVEIPMMPPLHEYLSKLKSESVLRPEDEYTEYVLPMHARMYLTNRTGVSYRIKYFLESCGIKTTKVPKGRTRAISVKDLHSCRHTFCYYAGLYGIPMNIVQGIVGHMTPEMTKHYSAHASLEAKREKMKLLPDFMGMSASETTTALTLSEREQLKQIINQLCTDDIHATLEFVKTNCSTS